MTFPLGSLRADPARGTARAAAETAVPNPRRRVALGRFALLLGAALWLFVVLALLTHHPADPGFSTSGTGEVLRNKAGRLGAWVSDLLYFTLGFSAWWVLLAAARAGVSAIARQLRAGAPAPPQPVVAPLVQALGLLLLLAASTSLEWTRLYRWESLLPGHAGGVLGHTLGPLSMAWMGFAGSGVLWIAMLVIGLALALRFSWLALADAIGAAVEGLLERRLERREQALDEAIGERLASEREQVVEAQQAAGPPHLPIVIEPPLLEVPPSERVIRERQKPLFAELTDTRLPQVDLLDAAPARSEPVSETPWMRGSAMAAAICSLVA